MRLRASLSPASLRAMPHFSHSNLPSSRWSEVTVRLPLMESKRSREGLGTSSSAFLNSGWLVAGLGRLGGGKVVADGVGQDEVAVGQALHQRAGAEAVGAVVGEIRLAQHEQARAGCSSGCSPPTVPPMV